MPIPVSCAACNAKLKAPDPAAGRKLKCPACGQPVPVPARGAARATPPPASRPVRVPPKPPVAPKEVPDVDFLEEVEDEPASPAPPPRPVAVSAPTTPRKQPASESALLDVEPYDPTDDPLAVEYVVPESDE